MRATGNGKKGEKKRKKSIGEGPLTGENRRKQTFVKGVKK